MTGALVPPFVSRLSSRLFCLCPFSFSVSVPVCLSTDVTGALVLSLSSFFRFVSRLNSFAGSFLLLVSIFTLLNTGVSVHRRDRCTFSPNQIYVLVSLSTDATGSLVLSPSPVLCSFSSGRPPFLFPSLVFALVCPSTDATGAPVLLPSLLLLFRRYVAPSCLPLGTFVESCRNMLKPNKQQLTDSNELGIQATLMVHYPSKIHAPEGILLTTYDQLHSQIAKCETTVYAFPTFGAAQSVMRTLHSMQQTAIFVFECHANTGPVEISAKIFDTCNKYIPAIREIRQITESIKYQRYPTVLYLVTMNYLDNNRPLIIWKVPDTLSDELIFPARIAYERPDGRELRHGQLPGVAETSTASNGCYNSDKSKGSIPLTIKYQQNSSLQRLKVREVIESLLKETSVLQDTQFQIQRGFGLA